MIIILILLLSTLSAQAFEIKGARVNYHGSHILHDWVGMREYNNMQCTDVEEFYDDLKKIKYIKRLFNVYKNR